jgi:crotonobetainyl-CoA:carnitine CoA-transferase CaiB-like acyl-CoA transferase
MKDKYEAPPGPLSGVRIIDFTSNMAGPFGTMLLADQGAEVIKVEAPEGDILRRIGVGRSGTTTYFANLNRGKRSIVLDLREQKSQPVVSALLDSADVLVHAFRPAIATEFGLDAESVRKGRSSLIHVSVVGYGQEGPLAGRPVYDHVIQAMAGMASIQATSKDPVPRLVRHGVVDKATGYSVAQSIASALFQRERTGQGHAVSVCMLDVAVHFLWPDGMMDYTSVDSLPPSPSIANSFKLTMTSDGYLAMTIATAGQYRSLVESLNLQVEGTEGLSTLEQWLPVAPAVLRAAASRIREMKTEDALSNLSAGDVPCAPVIEREGIARLPQVIANGLLGEVSHPELGLLRQPRPVPVFGADHPGQFRPAPALGQDTEEILLEMGMRQP